jgi:hypothetical protein
LWWCDARRCQYSTSEIHQRRCVILRKNISITTSWS